jgi:hypothetical protein
VILLTCLRATRCYSEAITDCACGSGADATLCFLHPYLDDVHGACLREVLGAAEVPIDDAAPLVTLSAKWSNRDLAIGRVDALITECDYADCKQPCVFGKPNAAGGAGAASAAGGVGGSAAGGGSEGVSGSGGTGGAG